MADSLHKDGYENCEYEKETTTKDVIFLWLLCHAIFEELVIAALSYTLYTWKQWLRSNCVERIVECVEIILSIITLVTRSTNIRFVQRIVFCECNYFCLEGTPHQVPSCASENLRN